MSRKNQKKPSLPGDPYYTPTWVVDQCMSLVLPTLGLDPVTVLEPAAGTGAFLTGLTAAYPDAVIEAVDNDLLLTDWPGVRSHHQDFLTWAAPIDTEADEKPYDLVVGNPPYTLALPFVEKSLTLSDTVVFLLRQGFMSSSRRNEFFRSSPPSDVFVLAHRPSFTGNHKTDQADYCFMCWTGRAGETRVHWLPTVPLEVRRARAA